MMLSRRDIVLLCSGVGFLGSMKAGPTNAFPNKINDKYDDRPKYPGAKPRDLGIAIRTDLKGYEYLGLKQCGPAPNCFCSTIPRLEDPEHYIPAWKWPVQFEPQLKMNMETAFAELEKTILQYEPGQGNIDGGGFNIIKSDPEKGYLYVQFESLQNGYIDDVEFAYIEGRGSNMIQVRSSSRIGYLDFGVNAKRLNHIAAKLRSKGWDAEGVDFETHGEYCIQNKI